MRTLIWLAPALFFGMQVAASADTILPGTTIQVRTDAPIELHLWDRGRIYPAHVTRNVYARDGDLAIPAGSYAELVVRRVGEDDMALDLQSVSVNGNRYVMDTQGPRYDVQRSQSNGGLLGTIVGALSGGQMQVMTQGSEIEVPANARLTFQLDQPLSTVDLRYDRDHYRYRPDYDRH